MFYTIRHITKFRYSAPVSESIMELRMQPRTEGAQRCLNFQAKVLPRTRVSYYRDYLGNTVHHFDVPGQHRQLVIVAESLVDVRPADEIPAALGPETWDELDALIAAGDYWEMLMPSHFAQPCKLLREFAAEIGLASRGEIRKHGPVALFTQLNQRMADAIAYESESTAVDSPIEVALRNRKGVCQDFAHIAITLLRNLGVPARYVSGYLFHRQGDNSRSAEGATHAWVEVLLPHYGWIGLDPTNNVMVSDRHVRTAVGRDYADVPPSKGVFKGAVKSELKVTVQVTPSDAPPPPDEEVSAHDDWSQVLNEESDDAAARRQQQQQQQQ